MRNHGVEFADRWPQTIERLEALKTIWTQERGAVLREIRALRSDLVLSEAGAAAISEIVLGTLDTPFGREQVARHADGWLPLTFDVARTKQSIDDVRARMRAHGRDDSKLEVSLFFLEDKEQPLEVLHAARDLGVVRVILRLPVAEDACALASLDVLRGHGGALLML